MPLGFGKSRVSSLRFQFERAHSDVTKGAIRGNQNGGIKFDNRSSACEVGYIRCLKASGAVTETGGAPTANRRGDRFAGLDGCLLQESPLRYVSHIEARVVDLFREACRRDLEGLVAKWQDGPDLPGDFRTS